ncbi:MAG: hypothetical protein HZA14_07140 [Nitrospirae bacterium]|nr:hypothetical protein [Nitrospirota bacterium]
MIRNRFDNAIIFLAALFILLAVEKKSFSVPVIPNESMISGMVSEYAIVSSRIIGIKPEQVIYRLTITVKAAENIQDKPNLLGGKKGQDVQFHSKEKLSPELFGKKIKATAALIGDERGGLFWIRNIELTK